MSAASLGLAAAGGYLLGSVPWGLLLLRARGGPDPRTVGSGNIGATNVTRAGGRAIGAATLLLDAAKGAAPPLVALRWGADAAAVAGLAAVTGHCHPAWLRFRGGKGVATFLGAASVLAWPLGLPAFVVAWGSVLLVVRYVSLASLAGCAAAVAAGAATGAPRVATLGLLLAFALVAVRHGGNLSRVRAGTEPRASLGRERESNP